MIDENIQATQLTPAAYILAIACLLAWREESGNGVAGMVGVLHNVRNRAKAGWHGGSILANIVARNQFSSMTVPGDGQLTKWADPSDNGYGPGFQKLLSMAPAILSGASDDSDPTAGALYYADLTSPGFQKGSWFDKNIVNSSDHPIVARIGSTSYFK